MQLLQHQPDVVACAAQHGVQCITERAFERVTGQPAVRVHVPNGRLNGT